MRAQIPAFVQIYLSALLLTTSALAQPATPDGQLGETPAAMSAEARALQLFQAARLLYDAGDVDAALEHLQQARDLLPDPCPQPVIVFNIARAHETLGQLQQARTAYNEYLTLDPEAADRGAIEIRIAAIDARLAEQARLQEELDSVPDAPPETVNHFSTVVASTGVAALGVAVGLRVAARERRKDAIADPVHDSASQTFDDAQDLARAATALFVVGGLAAAAGLTWLIAEIATADRGTQVAVSVSPRAMSLRVRF